MEFCRHTTLVLAPVQPKLRCRTCHLSLSTEELGDSFCPECFEANGQRNYDFEDVEDESSGRPTYFCEDCGSQVG